MKESEHGVSLSHTLSLSHTEVVTRLGFSPSTVNYPPQLNISFFTCLIIHRKIYYSSCSQDFLFGQVFCAFVQIDFLSVKVDCCVDFPHDWNCAQKLKEMRTDNGHVQ